ncbi:alpha/beta hydrolase family protein [Bibersteinia trehalosi]|uniref:subtype B tannase n=1 Tax=Bibersteinia trehalosi TaxID=47735 RepID=UPI0010536C31|nr:subtype B tannase [Bibersteinia trehalosi]TCT14437.1 alpha/beta hydrolase family protein [Bibersteinia trehalosi]
MRLSKFITTFTVASLSTALFAAPPAKRNPLADLPFANQTEQGFSLTFEPHKFVAKTAELNGESLPFRAVEKIVYVKNPIEAEYQTLNFYVPEAYFKGEEINGYTAETAPIFLPNAVGGYMPALAATADQGGMRGRASTILQALKQGYVVASVGARGRTLGREGNYTGKAPAVILDLKAAVRYLRANDALMAGDANKIISNGTSAGGAMSALLAASGDHSDYADLLKTLGAAEASDAIFAASVYCPITDLEHADMAYEWQFNKLHDYERKDMSRMDAQAYNDRTIAQPMLSGTLNAQEITISDRLKAAYPAYLNSLNLQDSHGKPLTLDDEGNGSFKDFIVERLIASANKAISEGQDLSQLGWLKIENGKVIGLDFEGFVAQKKRMKSPPAFDALDLSSGENNFFGDQTTNNKHFTPFGLAHSQVKGAMADPQTVKLVNAMNYTDNHHAAQHWRIRVGSADYDTSHAISAALTAKLRMSGKTVDYALPWDVPHSGDYDLDELFQWIDSIAK